MPQINSLILLRGGGDLASGIALRLHRAGLKLVISELAQPLAVRRSVSFAEAVYEGRHSVEGVTARLVEPEQLSAAIESDDIPILIDPHAEILHSSFHFPVVIDARLMKQAPTPLSVDVLLHIGVGPGFHAGQDCDAVIETRRSHTLGRVFWHGSTQVDSGQPEGDPRRVLRAPNAGVFIGHKKIGEHCEEGELIAEIESPTTDHASKIITPISGVLRGILRDGLYSPEGMKVGDVDPRNDVGACYLVSDKALAIGGGVLEAILSKAEIREKLWTLSALRAPPPNPD
jgi:xanthine dehydrogenase accessory factor